MKKFDTDELRAQLETFSPEQQRDEDRELFNQDIGDFQKSARIVEQSVSHCREISRQIDASTAKVEKILPVLQQASTVRVDENIKASIQNVAAKIGGDVADVFGKKVRAVLDDVDKVSRRVSIPIDYALVYLVTMFLSSLFWSWLYGLMLHLCILESSGLFLEVDLEQRCLSYCSFGIYIVRDGDKKKSAYSFVGNVQT